MIQNVSPFLEGVEEYLKLKPEHPELAVRVGRCLHRVGELTYPEPDKPPAKRLLRRSHREASSGTMETIILIKISIIIKENAAIPSLFGIAAF